MCSSFHTKATDLRGNQSRGSELCDRVTKPLKRHNQDLNVDGSRHSLGSYQLGRQQGIGALAGRRSIDTSVLPKNSMARWT